MSATSPVAICNRALTLVGGNTIISFDDETIESKLCNIHYDQVRDAVTSVIEWSFATKRFGPLTPHVDAPAFGFNYRYTMPPDFLLLLEASTDPKGRREISRYVMEEGHLLADIGTGINIKYLARITDTTKFVQPYTEALVARMAAELAVPLTESRTLQAQFFKIYERKVDEAAAVDNIQGRNIKTTAVNHQIARFAGGYAGAGFYNAGQ